MTLHEQPDSQRSVVQRNRGYRPMALTLEISSHDSGSSIQALVVAI